MDDKAMQPAEAQELNTPQSVSDNPLDIPSDIFLADKFPSNGRSYEFTPTDLHNALVEYSKIPTSLEGIAKAKNLRIESIYALMEKYEVIRKAYQVARSRKAEVWHDHATDQYHIIPQDAYEVDKYGNTRLSQAYVTLMRDKAKQYNRAAALANPAKYADKHRIESQNLNVNVNTNVADGKDLSDAVHSLLND